MKRKILILSILISVVAIALVIFIFYKYSSNENNYITDDNSDSEYTYTPEDFIFEEKEITVANRNKPLFYSSDFKADNQTASTEYDIELPKLGTSFSEEVIKQIAASNSYKEVYIFNIVNMNDESTCYYTTFDNSGKVFYIYEYSDYSYALEDEDYTYKEILKSIEENKE